jgi:copper(I)-binding protein
VRNWQRTFASCCSLVAAAACGATAADVPPRGPVLFASSAWARAADSGATTALYFTLENRDSLADTVNGVSAGVAETASLHVSMQHSGMMHMTPVRALPLPARDSVSFRPLGAHVMLTGLKRPLADGDTVYVTLQFTSGDTVAVSAHVRKP